MGFLPISSSTGGVLVLLSEHRVILSPACDQNIKSSSMCGPKKKCEPHRWFSNKNKNHLAWFWVPHFKLNYMKLPSAHGKSHTDYAWHDFPAIGLTSWIFVADVLSLGSGTSAQVLHHLEVSIVMEVPPNGWFMIYNGKSLNGWVGGPPILRTPHLRNNQLGHRRHNSWPLWYGL